MSEKPMGCCKSCDGTGVVSHVEALGDSPLGYCWDCYGTGHRHDPKDLCLT